ncbi:hypothetical protein E5082_26010 [Streptomyces griseoluteus]|uniref:DUF3592 domain-containing protein n=1 Tax=Streptomyces griseoluteus TaxID=29306 RepID=A0A4Z1D638_STRGP|nr:DUF3592 domain-containing protein [Streptomyces griseoluteus]TGN77452.1 hypothetical protein E5082_26010 [Streptomyces griseoluteus]GHF25348.1 hypothetical protein GCM10017776_49710 [Streptomyces griseoluteus]
MDALLYLVPGVITAGCVFGAVQVIRRALRTSRMWAHGLTAVARCLNTYTKTSGGNDTAVSSTLHHVYEFTTREGERFRFDEAGGDSTVVAGDHLVVRYLAERPQWATALQPARGRLILGTAVLLAFLAVIILGCLLFAVTARSVV